MSLCFTGVSLCLFNKWFRMSQRPLVDTGRNKTGDTKISYAKDDKNKNNIFLINIFCKILFLHKTKRNLKNFVVFDVFQTVAVAFLVSA